MKIEEYLLLRLAEECAEIAQRITKALSFGLDEVQPGQYFNNAERIVEEINDFEAVKEICERHGIILNNYISGNYHKKLEKIRKFAAISAEKGTLPQSELERLIKE